MKELKDAMKNAQAIKTSDISSYQKNYESDKTNTVLRHVLSNDPITSVVRNLDNSMNNLFKFNKEIETMPVTNQLHSGRCWIFAGCNVLREYISKKLNLKDFELSQSYLAFWDKFEKVNYLLESIIDLIDVDHDDRILMHILNVGIGDGGQWDMFVNVVKKYGLVPKSNMIETFQSSNTPLVNQLLNYEMRKFAANAKHLYEKDGLTSVRKLKDELLNKIYAFLCNAYGKPVTNFNFEYTDKDGKYNIVKDLTPTAFFEKYVGDEIDKYVSIINSPTKDKPFHETYTISYLGNVVGGKEIHHLNLPMDRIKELILTQLDHNEIVWFGSDCGKYSNRDTGIWDVDVTDYKTPFGLDFDLSKEDNLDYFASVMNHAMCITGVNLDNNTPTKWKIENSWGSDHPNAGYYVMMASWFDRFVYQAVIKKEYLSLQEQKEYEKEAHVLNPWDPMGTLAD